MIKCSLTQFGRAGRENIWLSVRTHGPLFAWSVFHDLGPNILSHSVNKYILRHWTVSLIFHEVSIGCVLVTIVTLRTLQLDNESLDT